LSSARNGRFIFTLKLPRIIVLIQADDLELLKHPRVYALADEFLMDDLKTLALQRFKLVLHGLWISDTFVDCIQEIYSTTYGADDKLRQMVVHTAQEHLKELWKKTRFQDLVRENGDFAVDLVGRLSTIPCPNYWGHPLKS
jgi:hypothetical protein